MRYALLNKNDVVVGISCKEKDGFIPVHDEVVCGMVLEGGEYVDPPIKYTLDDVRDLRDKMLKESDWTQLSDSPLSEKEKAASAKVRQKLRDVTALKPSDAMKFLLGLKNEA